MTPKTRILLGVTGGIAAYKSPDLVRRLIERGAEVQVVMTAGAQQFRHAHELSGGFRAARSRSDLWDSTAEAAMGHIELARWAQLVLIAPASADFIARLAGGRADDLLAALCIATEAPMVLAPAMNRIMWANKATQANVDTLISRGVRMLGPATGNQACGEVGAGRMWEPKQLAETLLEPPVNAGLLAGLNVLITAGPTRERLDPVRYLTNRSSGKMGFAVAAAAREAGAHVTLVDGTGAVADARGHHAHQRRERARYVCGRSSPCGRGGRFHRRRGRRRFSAGNRRQAEDQEARRHGQNRSGAAPDIIKSVADMAKRPFVVGFAAETNDVEENARIKLKRKKLDMIAANQVGDGIAFDCEDNALTVLWPGGKLEIARAPKLDVARELIALIAKRLPPSDGAPRRGSRKRRRKPPPRHGDGPAHPPAQPPHPPLIRCSARSSCGSWIRASGANFPCPGTPPPGSAGMDLRACLEAPLVLAPGAAELIPTGISIYVEDPALAALLLPRSGSGTRAASCSAIWWA